MRVCYILNEYPSRTEIFVHDEIMNLIHGGLDISVVSLFRSPLALSPEMQSRTQYATERAVPQYGGERMVRAGRRSLLRRVRRRMTTHAIAAKVVPLVSGCSHIHAHFAGLPSAVAMRVAEMCDMSFSFSAHARDVFADPWDLDALLTRARFAVACSSYLKACMRDMTNADLADKIAVIHHGVDTEKWRGVREARATAKRATGDGPLRLLSVGRLVPKKGFRRLLEGCSCLKSEGVSFRLEIIGDGPLRHELMRQVEGGGLGSQVQFLGYVPHAELIAHYEAADVFVLPCIIAEDGDMDNIPNTLLEAMACGVPVVTVDVGGISELVDGTNGRLLPLSSDPGSIASAIKEVGMSRELRDRYAENALATLESGFCQAGATDQLMALLRDVEA